MRSALIILLLSGCASAPKCEKWKAYSVNTDEGPMIALDMENVHKLIAMLEGLNSGSCRLEKKGEI